MLVDPGVLKKTHTLLNKKNSELQTPKFLTWRELGFIHQKNEWVDVFHIP